MDLNIFLVSVGITFGWEATTVISTLPNKKSLVAGVCSWRRETRQATTSGRVSKTHQGDVGTVSDGRWLSLAEINKHCWRWSARLLVAVVWVIQQESGNGRGEASAPVLSTRSLHRGDFARDGRHN
eukprot:121946_1